MSEATRKEQYFLTLSHVRFTFGRRIFNSSARFWPIIPLLRNMIFSCLPVLIILRLERKIKANGNSWSRISLDNVVDNTSLFDLKIKNLISNSRSLNVCLSYHTHVKIKIATVHHLLTCQIVSIVKMETESILIVFVFSGGFARQILNDEFDIKVVFRNLEEQAFYQERKRKQLRKGRIINKYRFPWNHAIECLGNQ